MRVWLPLSTVSLSIAALACELPNDLDGAGAVVGDGVGASEPAPGPDEEVPHLSFGFGGGGSGELNPGFIGGACATDADCAYDGGFCLGEAEGFPGGMCSLDCSLYCPDKEGATSTFCAEPADLDTTADGGLCTTRCDFGVSSTGCRPGYQCQALPRHDQPETVVFACTPGEDAPLELTPCQEELVARGISWSPALNPLDHPDGHPELLCDIEDPVWIVPVRHEVSFRPSSLDNAPSSIFAACPLALAIDDSAGVMQSLGITDAVHYGVYNCRVIAGTSTLSEHGLANAIDIAGVKRADGSYYSVLDDWESNQPAPVTEGGALLKDFATTVFDTNVFNIVLTPDYNAAHENHFHCDLTDGAHFMK